MIAVTIRSRSQSHSGELSGDNEMITSDQSRGSIDDSPSTQFLLLKSNVILVPLETIETDRDQNQSKTTGAVQRYGMSK